LNIILISIDTLSAKHLPTYGYEFDTAPFIDQVLAKEGVVFDRCVAAATTTPQAHMSMFTSVQPCVHGVVNGLEVVTGKLTLLAEVLRAAGYETGAVTEDAWLACERGFGRGFNDCMENKSPDIMLVEGQIGLTLARAREWVQRNADMSFFLFVHTYQVHEPYAPPDEYRDLFRVRDGQEVGDDAPRGTSEVVGYDQEIRYTDDELRKFVDFLRDQKLLDRTAIVLTSDHGEEFAEHGFRRHGPTLYDEVTRVPLILWGPSLLPRGKRVTETVGHIDLMPTILDIAGLAAPTGASGMSLLPLARGEAGVPPGPRYTEARVPSALNKDYEQVAFTPPAFLVETGLHKLSRYNDDNGFRYEFYDLGTDTGERNNRFSDGSAPVVQLQGLVDAYESGCRAAAVRLGSEAKEAVTLDPANMEKLRALGYVR
jgi:arylsulfatase A-like enzyme